LALAKIGMPGAEGHRLRRFAHGDTRKAGGREAPIRSTLLARGLGSGSLSVPDASSHSLVEAPVAAVFRIEIFGDGGFRQELEFGGGLSAGA
jgi:hypothetical protein